MAKNQNTYAKRLRETDKKIKAAEKRARRQRRSEEPTKPAQQTPTTDSVTPE